MSVCPGCAADPQPDGFADPRKCAFRHGVFTRDNWNCVTLNQLRELIDTGRDGTRYDYQSDEGIGTVWMDPEGDGDQSYGYIVLQWYKRRGRVQEALFIDGSSGQEPLTFEHAKTALAEYSPPKDPSCFYFGVWGQPGHSLVSPGGGIPDLKRQFRHALCCELDGGFAPKKSSLGLCWGEVTPLGKPSYLETEECPQGQFLRHVVMGYTVLQWWDRCQGDTRPGCNSSILLEGDHPTERVLAALDEHFPNVRENLKRHGVELVEVKG